MSHWLRKAGSDRPNANRAAPDSPIPVRALRLRPQGCQNVVAGLRNPIIACTAGQFGTSNTDVSVVDEAIDARDDVVHLIVLRQQFESYAKPHRMICVVVLVNSRRPYQLRYASPKRLARGANAAVMNEGYRSWKQRTEWDVLEPSHAWR